MGTWLDKIGISLACVMVALLAVMVAVFAYTAFTAPPRVKCPTCGKSVPAYRLEGQTRPVFSP